MCLFFKSLSLLNLYIKERKKKSNLLVINRHLPLPRQDREHLFSTIIAIPAGFGTPSWVHPCQLLQSDANQGETFPCFPSQPELLCLLTYHNRNTHLGVITKKHLTLYFLPDFTVQINQSIKPNDRLNLGLSCFQDTCYVLTHLLSCLFCISSIHLSKEQSYSCLVETATGEK